MSVKKIKINREQADRDAAIDIPLDMDFQNVDNTDIIERDFTDDKIEEFVNPIVDEDKVRFRPYYEDNEGTLHEIKIIDYNLHFLDSGGNHPSSATTYDEIGFVKDDLRFRKNHFTNSFLRLNFYNSDVTTDQSLLDFSDLFCSLRNEVNDQDLQGTEDIGNDNLPDELHNIPVKFELTNPSILSVRRHEGIHLYWYKDDIPKEFFMQATFNNAKNGISTDFMVEDGQFKVDEFVDKLHSKFILKENTETYYYVLDTSYVPSAHFNIDTSLSGNNAKLEINLYEVNVS